MTLATIARAGRVFRRGLRYRYPPCCIIRFSWDIAWNRSPGQLRGHAGNLWIPCGMFHPTIRTKE